MFTCKSMLRAIVLFVLPALFAAVSSPAADSGKKAAKGTRTETKIWTEPLTGMEFVFIKGGCFMMGQTEAEGKLLKKVAGEEVYDKYYTDELPRHRVCVSDFWMGRYEVTQRQWLEVMASNPSHFNENPDNPVDMVSWNDCQRFIERLNRNLKKQGVKDFVLRLPTEAEWEYAARAGTTTMFSTGDEISTDLANYNGHHEFGLTLRGEYRKGPTPAGSFPPNPFGLYDMHGNVWEWCHDWYGRDYYKNSPEQDPPGPDTGNARVMRGGSWFRFAGAVRSATRYKHEPDGQYADSGLRLGRVEAGRRFGDKKARPGGSFSFDEDF